MIYVAVALAVVTLVTVVALVGLLASRDDPMGVAKTNQRAFTRGLGTIFGERRSS
ncbi:MAG: hypothetical protein QNJ71_01665 [Acidimicrobiia bacterium]|nr:hypothetical protein [Acidimicrobiia bacterium]